MKELLLDMLRKLFGGEKRLFMITQVIQDGNRQVTTSMLVRKPKLRKKCIVATKIADMCYTCSGDGNGLVPIAQMVEPCKVIVIGNAICEERPDLQEQLNAVNINS